MKPSYVFLAGVLLAACAPTDVSPSPSGLAANQAVTTTIPTQFQGTWTPNSEGKNLPGMENPTVIGATTWQGHESYGKVQSVRSNAPNDITISVAMTGEGAAVGGSEAPAPVGRGPRAHRVRFERPVRVYPLPGSVTRTPWFEPPLA